MAWTHALLLSQAAPIPFIDVGGSIHSTPIRCLDKGLADDVHSKRLIGKDVVASVLFLRASCRDRERHRDDGWIGVDDVEVAGTKARFSETLIGVSVMSIPEWSKILSSIRGDGRDKGDGTGYDS